MEVPSSSGDKEANRSSNNNEPLKFKKEEYTFDTRPRITNIKVREISQFKIPRRVVVIGSEKYTILKRKYLDELTTLINTWRRKPPGSAINVIKESSSYAYFIEELISQLKETEQKPLRHMKALYYLFISAEAYLKENVSIKMTSIENLKKFVIASFKYKTLKYLLKDLAVNILLEMGYVSIFEAVVRPNAYDFRYLEEASGDLYGTTVAWLSNLDHRACTTPGQYKTEYSGILLKRALNSPRIRWKLMSVCGKAFCCEPEQSGGVSLTETNNFPNSSKDVPLMEMINSFPAQLEAGSFRKSQPLYDKNLVNDLNNLIRHETINYTPVWDVKYEQRKSKSSQFIDLIFNEWEERILSHAGIESLDKFDERETEDFSCSLKDLQEDTDSPQSSYVTEHKSSYIEDEHFWGYWDIFSSVEISIDTQRVFFGYMSPLENKLFDIYSSEKANVRHTSTSSNLDTLNVKRNQNVFDSFEMPDESILSQAKKPSRKRKLSPYP